jgi:hypothetical protein
MTREHHITVAFSINTNSAIIAVFMFPSPRHCEALYLCRLSFFQSLPISCSVKGGAIANDPALVEYDLAVLDVHHGSELVVEELVSATFDVFRESDPVTD